MIYKELTLDEGLKLAAESPYAYIKNMSSMHLGKNAPALIDTDQLLEGRFFDTDREIRLIREAGELKAFSFTAEEHDDFIPTEGKPLDGFGSSFKKRSYISYDDDGQAYVSAVCLAGWEE